MAKVTSKCGYARPNCKVPRKIDFRPWQEVGFRLKKPLSLVSEKQAWLALTWRMTRFNTEWLFCQVPHWKLYKSERSNGRKPTSLWAASRHTATKAQVALKFILGEAFLSPRKSTTMDVLKEKWVLTWRWWPIHSYKRSWVAAEWSGSSCGLPYTV